MDTGSKYRGKYNENNDRLIVLRFPIERSLSYIVYATVPNPFVKKRHLVNLERFVNSIDVEASYSGKDKEAKYYFLLLKTIVRMINKNELPTLEILLDYLILGYRYDKEIPINTISLPEEIDKNIIRMFEEVKEIFEGGGMPIGVIIDAMYDVIDLTELVMEMEDENLESFLSKSKVLAMNSYIETRVGHGFLNEKVRDLINFTRDLVGGEVSDIESGED